MASYPSLAEKQHSTVDARFVFQKLPKYRKINSCLQKKTTGSHHAHQTSRHGRPQNFFQGRAKNFQGEGGKNLLFALKPTKRYYFSRAPLALPSGRPWLYRTILLPGGFAEVVDSKLSSSICQLDQRMLDDLELFPLKKPSKIFRIQCHIF